MIGTLTMPSVQQLVQCAGLVVASTGLAWLVSGWAVDRWPRQATWKVRAVFPALEATLTLALVVRFGCTPLALAGALFGILALYASYADVRCREVDDSIHLMLVLVGMIGVQPQDVPAMVLAGVLVSLPLVLVVAVGYPMGGADLKYTAAYAFGAGVTCGGVGLAAGMLLAVVHQKWKRNKHQGFPLIPYLSTGFGLSFILFGGV